MFGGEKQINLLFVVGAEIVQFLIYSGAEHFQLVIRAVVVYLNGILVF